MKTIAATGAPIVLDEHKSIRVAGLRPSRADIDACESEELRKRITLRWLRDDVLEITAGSHVGVVNLDCASIHIQPKLAGRELAVLQMLDYASGLNAQRHLDRLQQLGEGLHLRDLICLLLTREADRLLRHGLRRDYLRREEALPALRGRLLADRQILRRHGRLDRLECRHDEFSSDILDNQVCAAALQLAARTADDNKVRAHARRLAADFADACAVDAFDARQAEERRTYHRGNEHYRAAHRWALMLLNGTAFADLYSATGPTSQAFMLDMNTLFEAFVTQLLRDATQGTGITVHPQQALSKAIRRQDGNSYTTIKPDIQLAQGHGRGAWRCSIDAKYKLYHDGIAISDLYQSFTYAQAFNSTNPGTPTAFILYASDQNVRPRSVSLHNRDNTLVARITSIAINISHVLEALASHNPQLTPADLRALIASGDFDRSTMWPTWLAIPQTVET